MKICIDAGHGGNDVGCSGFGKIERDLNLEYSMILKNELELYKEVQIIMTRMDNSSNPTISQRAKMANDEQCDLFLSCHLNAFNGKAMGTETIHSIYACDQFKAFAKMVGVNLAQALDIPFRRSFYKEGNNGDYYGVIRETRMVALIIEPLFLDNETDSKAYNPYKISKSIADSIVRTYNLELKKNENFKVICGSFTDKINAEKRVAVLKEKGFDSFILNK